jgi:hypothetical protein
MVDFAPEEPPEVETYRSLTEYIEQNENGKTYVFAEYKDVVPLECAAKPYVPVRPSEYDAWEKEPHEISECLKDADRVDPVRVLARKHWQYTLADQFLAVGHARLDPIVNWLDAARLSPAGKAEMIHALAWETSSLCRGRVSGVYKAIADGLTEDDGDGYEPSELKDTVLRELIISKVLSGNIYADRAVSIIAKLDGYLSNQARKISDSAHNEVERRMTAVNHTWFPKETITIIAEQVYSSFRLDLPKHMLAVIGSVSAERIANIASGELTDKHGYNFAITGPGQQELAEELGVRYIGTGATTSGHFANGQALAIATHAVVVGKGRYEVECNRLGIRYLGIRG